MKRQSQTPDAATAAARARLDSLDVFRGLTIASMILVNNPGNWNTVYGPLRHAPWDGCTPTDLIFPFFLFIAGVAIPFSMRAPDAAGRAALVARIFRRSLIIFAFGMLLALFPFFKFATVRIPGVLQRIAVCYLVAALIFLFTDRRGQLAAIAALLLGYWALMTLAPVPGYGAGVLTPEGNLAAYIDNALMHSHLYRPTWDPEGILSTLPAIASVLLGVLAGQWLRSGRRSRQLLIGLSGAGAALVLAGWLWGRVFPINKALWSSSYTLYTAGLAALGLAVCLWIVDLRGWKQWALPFTIFGRNSILVYVLAGLIARGLVSFKVTASEGPPVFVKTYLYETFFAPLASPINASLLYALCFVVILFVPMAILYAKGIFLKA
ncbi:MAG: acyltransferase family protein [Acidobacteriota bacterium]